MGARKSLAISPGRRVAFRPAWSGPLFDEESLLTTAPSAPSPIITPLGGGAGRLLAMLVARPILAGTPERIAVRQVPLVIGAGSDADLVVADCGLDDRHAELSLSEGIWLLTDLDSTTGSAVDGEPAVGPAVVAPGSAIRLGGLELVLVPHDRWEDSPPSRPMPEVLADPGRRPVAPPLFLSEETGGAAGNRSLWVAAAVFAAAVLAFLLLRSG